MREENAVDKYVRVNQDGLFEPVWMYRDVLPFILSPDPATNNNIVNNRINLGAGNPPTTIAYKLPHSSIGADDGMGNPFLIDQIVQNSDAGQTLAAFTVFVTDNGDVKQYMNAPIHARTFGGSGQLSARLAEDLLLPTRHQLMVRFQIDAFGDTQSVQLYFMGKFFDTWSTNLQKYQVDGQNMKRLVQKWLERRKYVSPYWMTTDGGAVTVPANQTVTIDTVVGSEGHFECTHILRPFKNGNAATAPFEVSLINPQTRQMLMNGPIHSFMIGDALNPQPFPAPFLAPAGQYIRFQIKDLSGSSNTVYLTLRGKKWRCPIKDLAEVQREYGQVVNGLPSPYPASMNAEMEGVGA